MTQVLLYEKSWQRIEAPLRARYPRVQPVIWHADNTLSSEGQPLEASAVAPTAGWLSFDIMADRLMKPYCEALNSFASMEWIQTLNAGLDNPLYQTLFEQGVRISKSSAQALPIAEYVLGYALYHSQNMPQRFSQQSQQSWKMQRFSELAGSRWVIVGFGHIGRAVAKRARAFDAEIIALRRSARNDPLTDKTISLDQLAAHLPEADVVVLACPHDQQTDQMADSAFFSAMKPGSLLINVARGGLLNEADLLAALDAGRLGRAVLDVFASEPLAPHDPLWTHPSVVVTSHTSNAGSGTRSRGDSQFLTALGHFIDGTAIPDEV